MDDDQQFCLRWNNHQSTLISVFDTLLENGTLVDCTLAAEGKFLKAHKVVLSACSPYFAALLSQQYDKHPIFILKDVKFQELRAMMDYMYRGEVNISQDQLAALLKAAESLQIKGLSDNRGSSASTSAAPPSQQKQQPSETAAAKSLPPPVPVNKASGLTIENKRPLKSELHDSDLSGSREGSTSPTSRKRKKVRRGSVDINNLPDNHDQHSNSSSHSVHSSLQPQALALTSSSSIVTSVPAINNAATSLSSTALATSAATSANILASSAVVAAASAAIKKTESVQQQQVAEALKLQLVKQQQHHPSTQQQQQQKAQDTEDEEPSEAEQGDGQGNDDSDNENDEPQSKRQAQGGSADGEDGKSINQSELMIEPKNEYDDGQDENVEDLTLDEEELLDDLDQAGPSHGEGSSQGYAQWQMEREQNEAFMAAQDAVGGQHRDAQVGTAEPADAATATTAAKSATERATAAAAESPAAQPAATSAAAATAERQPEHDAAESAARRRSISGTDSAANKLLATAGSGHAPAAANASVEPPARWRWCPTR